MTSFIALLACPRHLKLQSGSCFSWGCLSWHGMAAATCMHDMRRQLRRFWEPSPGPRVLARADLRTRSQL